MSARSETRERAYALWRDSGGQMPLHEIASRLDVPSSKVRKWKSLDKWSVPLDEVERSTEESGTLHQVERSTTGKKKRGAPFGSKNALGNRGGHGAPKGNKHAVGHGAPRRNQNAVTTGEYATIWLDTLTDDERAYYESLDNDPLIQIDKMILDLSVREYRMMILLKELKGQRQNPIVADEKSDLADDVTRIIEQHEEAGKNGTSKQVVVNRQLMTKILAVEEALTRVQEAKRRALETKQKLLKEREGRDDFSKELNITIVRKGAGAK